MRRRILVLAAAALTALMALAPAAAQNVNTPQAYATAPADHLLVTPNGVDLRSGRFDYRQTDLAIGGEGDSGLQLTRIARGGIWGHVEPFANFTHNLDIMIAEKRVHIGSGNYSHLGGNDYRMIVRFGGRSDTFDGFATGPYYERISKIGTSRLTYDGAAAGAAVVYTFQAADGTVATFRPLGNKDCSSKIRCAYVAKIVLPDETILTFDYENPTPGLANTTRLRSVTSSRGYALLLEYGGNSWNSVDKACVINLARRAKPADNVCPVDAQATSRYAYTSLGELLLASSTDAAGAVSTYRYGQAGAYRTIGFVKPDAEAPWLTHHYTLGGGDFDPDQDGVYEVVARQELAGGQSYDIFGQTGAEETGNQVKQRAGGDIVDSEGHRLTVRYGFPRMPRTLAPGYNPEAPENFPDEGLPGTYQITAGPITVTDALGRTTRYDYCDPVIAAALPAQESDRCVVTPLRAYTDPEGIRTELTYDAFNNVSQVRRIPRPGSTLAPVTFTTLYACFSAEGAVTPKSCTKPARATDANGNVTLYSYAPEHGGVLTETGPAVNLVTPQKRYSYVQRTARHADGSPAAAAVWLLDRMSTCRTGNPSGAGCALGAADEVVTTYDYGADGGPNNLLLRGQAVIADGQTLRTCFAYDSLGRRISETGPEGTATFTSCPAGAPTEATPYTSSTRFDALGRVTGTIGPDPDGDAGSLRFAAFRNSYDPAGRLVRVEQGELAHWQPDSVAPKDWAGFTFNVLKSVDTRYDALDRKVREAVSGGGVTVSVTEYSYDEAGRLKCTAVRMNPDAWADVLADTCVPGPVHAVHLADRITRNVYDAAGQLLQAQSGVGTNYIRSDSFEYDLNGRRTSLTDARGYRAEMSYDGHGRQSRWIFPSKTTPGVANTADYEEYGYDPNGNRTRLKRRDGKVIGYEYDALNRVVVKDVPEFGLDVRYTYDLRNLQTGAWFTGTGQGVWTAHDGFGRIVSTTSTMGGVSRTVSHQYDRDGGRTETGFPDGQKFWFARDGLGRMTHAHQGALGSAPNAMIALGYNERGLRSSFTRKYGDSTLYGYDRVGRPASIKDVFAGGAGDVQWTFPSYSPASQLMEESRDNDFYAWNRATPVQRSYATNGLNQYTGTGGGTPPAAFGYDDNGNLTSVAGASGSTGYVYDSENRLVSASGASIAALVYDPLGRLFQISGGEAGVTQFLYDGDELVAEYNGAGTLLRRYVHGDGADDPLFWFEGAGLTQPRFPHADRQGSIVGVAGAGGGIHAINNYDEYGVPGTGNSGRFQYTGQAWLPELGLYYYKARLYSSRLGRFLQVDPIGYDDQTNLYAYVRNDPTNGVDPTGERCETEGETTTCTPEDKSFSSFSFKTPEGWTDFGPSDENFHSYPVDVALGQGDAEYGALLNDELQRHPTPGEGSASPGGTRIDVNIPGPWGKDHVQSYTKEDTSGRAFVANVTENDHTLHSGFVVRQVVSNGRGGFTLKTYGEGNSWKQTGYPGAITRQGERTTWVGNARTIIEHARARRAR